jgi:hypothetical protein
MPINQDDIPTPRVASRPALSIPAQVLSKRGEELCEKLVSAEWTLRRAGDNHGANSIRAFREHLAHKTREIAADMQEHDDAKALRRTTFFAACDYAGLLLRPFEASR